MEHCLASAACKYTSKKKSKTFSPQNTVFIEVMSKSLDFFEVWIFRAMNSIVNRAEESIKRELIYA